MKDIYDLAVIGGGPAGIASAVEASVLGLNVVLFEKGENHSTTIRTFYKDNKRVDKDWRGQKIVLEGTVHFMEGTKESTIELFDALIKSAAIETRFKTEIVEVIPEDRFYIKTGAGEEFTANNVIIAIGYMSKPNKPNYELPSSLKQRVHFNLDSFSSGEKVLVVGGGNSAAEYAYYLSDNNSVTLSYRKDRFSRLNPVNEDIVTRLEQADKLRLKLGVDIVGMRDQDGLPSIDFADGTTEAFDRVLYALGGSSPLDFLKRCRVELDGAGRAAFDENYQTSVRGLYVAGDIAAKVGGSIAASLNHAYRIVNHIKALR
ncbi:MAG: NAD(P)-binding domain-containing protein [Helicobacteraceae bacterium]|nr:NAD(P)-binding domain-containing protein [Helicobacteraceae bacterium]